MVEHAILAIGSGLFVGVLGILIRYGGMMPLIAGYDPNRVTNEEGLANFIGTHTLIVAALTVGVGVLELWETTADSEWYWLVFVIAVFVATRMSWAYSSSRVAKTSGALGSSVTRPYSRQ